MPPEILDLARRKRALAERMRHMAPGLAREGDRTNILEHARNLEAEAAALEAQARVAGAPTRSGFRQLLIAAVVLIASLMVVQIASEMLERASVRSNVIAEDRGIQLKPEQMQNAAKPNSARSPIRLTER